MGLSTPKIVPNTPKMNPDTPKMSPSTPKMSPTTPKMRLCTVLNLSWSCPGPVLALPRAPAPTRWAPAPSRTPPRLTPTPPRWAPTPPRWAMCAAWFKLIISLRNRFGLVMQFEARFKYKSSFGNRLELLLLLKLYQDSNRSVAKSKGRAVRRNRRAVLLYC
jgi:hypothetical protein